MKRLELLISEARESTGQQRYDSDSGISQALFVRYFKNAQDFLQKQIAIAKSKLLLVDEEQSVVSGQELYSYPSDLFLHNIDTIEHRTGSGDEWTPLSKLVTKNRRETNGFAHGYITTKDGFLLSPPIDGGTLRVNYIKKLPALEKRAGYISAITVSGGAITAMTVNVAESSFDGTAINDQYYLCIVDKHGDRKVKSVQYTSVNTSTGVFALPSNHTLASTDSTPAVGDYIVLGEDSYNKPDLDDICESFLLKHVEYQVKYGDASTWSKEVLNDLNSSASGLFEAFARPSDDVIPIPITNFDYLDIG